MTLMFDTATVQFDQYIMLLLPAAALLVMLHNIMRGGQRKWVIIMGGVTMFLFLLVFVLPVADYHHVRATLTDGSAKTIEGAIGQHSRIVERRFNGTSQGVGVTSSFRYTNVTIESFYVGQTWFTFEANDYPSQASFTNSGDPPIALRNGQTVRVRYFEDPWYGDEKRITQLVMLDSKGAPLTALTADAAGRQGAVPVAAKAALPADFDAFWTRFSRAAAAGDAVGIKALTRFPFLFAGTPLDAARFDEIWMGIFPAPIRPCFKTAAPMKDGDAWSVSCGVYVYVFNKGAAGWQFTDFAADPEAEQ